MKRKIHYLLLLILLPCSLFGQNSSRLIAQSYWSYDAGSYKLSDSSHNNYSGNNGWDWHISDWKYDNSMTWKMTAGNLEEYYKFTNSFNGSNLITSAKRENKTGGTWGLLTQADYNYTTNNQVADVVTTTTSGKSRRVYTYSGNLVTEEETQNWNTGAGAWAGNTKYIRSFNGNNQPVTITILQWNTTNSVWENAYRTTYTYTGLNLTEELRENFSSGWNYSRMLEYSYSGSNLVVKTEKGWNGSTWDPEWRTTYTYNSNNDQATTTLERFDVGGYTNQRHTDLTYDQRHNKIMERSSTWNTASNQFEPQAGDYELHYYYEGYTDGISKSGEQNSHIDIFPIPAQNRMTLRLTTTRPELIQVEVVDLTGKNVMEFSLPPQERIMYSVDISTLAPGSYLVHFSGNSVHDSHMIQIVK